MTPEWFSCPLLQTRESVKLLLGRNEEVLSASAREAGCSVQQLKLAMEKHLVLTEKERETMTAEEARLFLLLRGGGCSEGGCSCGGCSCGGCPGGGCSCGGACSGECSGECSCGRQEEM